MFNVKGNILGFIMPFIDQYLMCLEYLVILESTSMLLVAPVYDFMHSE